MTVRGAAVRLTIFAAISGLIALLLFNTLSNSVGRSTGRYTAMFDDASGLHSGDNVRVAGVRVGRVDSVSLDGGAAKVAFTVNRSQSLFTNTRVAIRYQNLIGQRFLALLPGNGTAPVLASGSKIPQTATEDALDLTVVINGFQPLFEVISPDDINRLSASIVAVLQGEGGSLVNLLRTTSQLTGHLADRDQLIGRVISNFATVLTDVGQRDGQVDDLIGQLRRLAAAGAADRDQIGGSIDALSGLTDATTDLLRDIRPQLKADLSRLEKVAGTYAGAQTAFGEAVQGLPVALASFARIMQYGSWTNLYLCNVYYTFAGSKPQQFANSGANSAVCS
ncbi:MAG TPA: MlaD family protein [Sporichthyaceae bacterium]|jgi:phospholipid/cholesterol/gamma-HCH transport system substrate-binding protein|nr:MlaD family protein [Sporichthyaceae bacterium]